MNKQVLFSLILSINIVLPKNEMLMKNANEVIVHKIKELRMKKKISQHYLAQKLNITVTAYNRIENNKTQLSVNMLFAISTALQAQINQFLDIPSNHVVKKLNSLITTDVDKKGLHVYIALPNH